MELLNKKRGELNEYLDRVDRDLSHFKNYCDDMKMEPIKDLFKDSFDLEDLKNDNE